MSITLRDLPLPVKVVATVFLMAVGLGYSSAMIQLHMQDSKSGKPLPTVEDVILKYTGKKKFDPNAPPPAPVSRLEALIMAPDNTGITGATMSPAFTTEDRAKGELKFSNAIKGKNADQVLAIREERKGEQLAFKLWINTPDEARKAAYAADKFVIPAAQMPKAFTAALKDGDAIKIKTLIDARCSTCHSKGGEKEEIPLDSYDTLAKFMAVSAPAINGEWVKVEEPISISKLTQSTHAHMLSFAVLFSLTGLVFACSSYPVWIRCILSPWVVIAVVADVSLWWLARLSDVYGPLFAKCIIVSGGLAGMGLGAQITLSLFNMYGRIGKVVIALFFVAGGAIAGLIYVNKIEQALNKPPKPQEVPQVKADPAPKAILDDLKSATTAIAEAANQKPATVAIVKPTTALEKLLMWPAVDFEGKPIAKESVTFNGADEGSMVPAFFEKDKVYKKFLESDSPQAEKDKMKAHRQGDLDVMLAWVRTPEAARKSAYTANQFDMPGLSDKSFTPEFLKNGKVQIKSLIDARCATCHGPDGKQADYPLDTYEGLQMYLKPLESAPKGN
jgi:mono/diheme cytochrome c family protein